MKLHVLEIIGKGAHDYIYRVRMPNRERRIAKYTLTPSQPSTDLKHPNIIARKEQFPYKDGWLQLYEDIDGIDLEQIMRHDTVKTHASTIIRQIAHGLAYAHEQSVIHRDIKPSNIILCSDGRVKIIDLERTTQLYGHETQVMGAKGYLAPETQKKNIYTPESDVFALGACWYMMLYNEAPPPYLATTTPPLVQMCLQSAPQKRPHLQLLAQLQGSDKRLREWSMQIIPSLIAQRRRFYHKTPFPKYIVLRSVYRYSFRALHLKKVRVGISLSLLAICLWMGTTFFLSLDPTSKTQSTPTKQDSSPPQTESPRPHVSTSQDTIGTSSDVHTQSKVKKTTKIKKKRTEKKGTEINSISTPPIQYSIRISSIPWGAKVWIDEEWKGNTLLQELYLVEGSHQLRMKYDTHILEQTINITASSRGFVWNIQNETLSQIKGERE